MLLRKTAPLAQIPTSLSRLCELASANRGSGQAKYGWNRAR
jgi:hypothetical protein